MNKLTQGQRDRAVEIALSGESPLKYLAECGSKNPSGAWFQIKKKLDMDTVERIEKARHNKANKNYREKAKEEKMDKKVDKGMPKQDLQLEAGANYEVSVKDAMDNMQSAADTFFGQCEEMGLKLDKAEPITKPVNYDGLEVAAVRHTELGEFHYDKKYASIDWRTPEGDEVSMPPAMWIMMVHELPKILNVLGVAC